MNADPKCFPEQREETRAPETGEEAHTSFWPWFALGVLLFCWIAEASMCAERGF
jgi:hypothetical protein